MYEQQLIAAVLCRFVYFIPVVVQNKRNISANYSALSSLTYFWDIVEYYNACISVCFMYLLNNDDVSQLQNT